VLSVDTTKTLTVTNAVTVKTNTGASTAGTVTGAGTVSAGSIVLGDSGVTMGNALQTATLTSTITTFTLSGGITYNSINGTSNRDLNPVLNLTSGTLTVGAGIDMGSVAVAGVQFVMGNSSPTLKINGSTPWTVPASVTITLNGTGATVNYTGASQALLVKTYNNLTLSGSGTDTGAVTTVSGNLALSGSVTYVTGAALAVTGTTTIGDGTTLTLGAFAFTSGAITVGGGTSGIFNASAASSGTKTFNSTVTVAAGGNMDLSNCTGATTIVQGATVTNNSSNDMNFCTGAKTLSGTGTWSIAAGSGSGAINFGAGLMTIPTNFIVANNYTNGTVTIGAVTLSAPVAANGATLASGSVTSITGALTFSTNTTANDQIITLQG
ncbi:MAG: beta strand repeat-containing protein, partial [Minisyncoccia bacterium]